MLALRELLNRSGLYTGLAVGVQYVFRLDRLVPSTGVSSCNGVGESRGLAKHRFGSSRLHSFHIHGILLIYRTDSDHHSPTGLGIRFFRLNQHSGYDALPYVIDLHSQHPRPLIFRHFLGQCSWQFCGLLFRQSSSLYCSACRAREDVRV